MAQNRRSEHEPTHLSSGEEEDASSSEGSESESEAEEEHDKSLPPTSVIKKPSATKKTPSPPVSSSDESGSESESEPDSPPKKAGKADPNIKPIASKPIDNVPKSTKKPRSKPSVPSSPPPAKSGTGAKRPVQESEARDSKRAKKNVSDAENGADGGKKTNGDDSKKQLFQRIWSEDDEIVILKGMIDYTEKNGTDPFADLHDFHNFIKKSLHVDVSKAQLSAKVRRLKKKYENNASKEKDGKERTFSKTHEQKGYELSKKIWGSVNGEGNTAGVNGTKVNGSLKKNQSQIKNKSVMSPDANGLDAQKEVSKMEVERNVEPPSGSVQFGYMGGPILVEEIIKDGLRLINGPKRMEMEEKWKNLKVKEMELYLKRSELIQEQTKLVLEAMKSSGNSFLEKL